MCEIIYIIYNIYEFEYIIYNICEILFIHEKAVNSVICKQLGYLDGF